MTEKKKCVISGCMLLAIKHSVKCNFHTNRSFGNETASSITHTDKKTGVQRTIPLVKKMTRKVKT